MPSIKGWHINNLNSLLSGSIRIGRCEPSSGCRIIPFLCTRVARVSRSRFTRRHASRSKDCSQSSLLKALPPTALDHGPSRFEEGRGSIQVFLSHSTCSSHCRNSASLPIGKYVDDESSYAAGSLDAGADDGSGFGDKIWSSTLDRALRP